MGMFLYGTVMSFITLLCIFVYFLGFYAVYVLMDDDRPALAVLLFMALISIASGFLYYAAEGQPIV